MKISDIRWDLLSEQRPSLIPVNKSMRNISGQNGVNIFQQEVENRFSRSDQAYDDE